MSWWIKCRVPRKNYLWDVDRNFFFFSLRKWAYLRLKTFHPFWTIFRLFIQEWGIKQTVIDTLMWYFVLCWHLLIRSRFASSNYRVPTQTGKLGKMGRHFPFREFWTDWKSQGISENCYFLFLVIFKRTVYYLLKWVKCSVEKKNKQLLEKFREFFQSGKVGTMYYCATENLREIDTRISRFCIEMRYFSRKLLY